MRPTSIAALLLLAAAGCSDDAEPPAPAPPDPIHIAVFMPIPEGSPAAGLPNLEWALESVNAAGGVAGRPLALDYIDVPEPSDFAAKGAELAADDAYVAVIGPPGSAGLADVAGAFVDANKPIVSTTSTSDDLLRAYGGKGPIWRTRESDIAQTELLIHYAQGLGNKRITLLTSLDVGGSTFFGWFGFFARELGYSEDDVNIVALPSKAPCDGSVMEALSPMPETLFVAPNAPEDIECIIKSLPPPGQPRPRIVFADTGLDPFALETLGAPAEGIEGFVGAGDEAFEAAFNERFPGYALAPHGPSEYDAVLLLAYGLEISGGVGGKALIQGMKDAVDGTEESPNGWDAEGIKGTLAALRKGSRPALRGATGPLVFEPSLYMDLASSTFAHYTITQGKLTLHERYSTADPAFLTSQGAFVKPGLAPKDVNSSAWTPAAAKTDTWAVIGALSTGFSNYRHQSDALQQYRLLKANGIADDHIILILADDIANDPENKLAGQVRNDPGGDDVYAPAEIDYGVSITAEDIQNILQGNVTATTPKVISPTASSNVYIYLAGHGGTSGIPLAAATTEEGLSGEGAVLSPTALRESLCAMQASGSFRRALIVIESCYSGAFGDAAYGGIELGCGAAAGDMPLYGAVLLTAANGKEVSYAGAYDKDVPAWVNDAFSRQLTLNTAPSMQKSLADVYTDTYQGTPGSHPSIYNADFAGQLSLVTIGEMITP